ncbi:hypothetical protein E2320_013610 [Naja naja]|nr:hypothetical protein E2320_013610 [Naja naja]
MQICLLQRTLGCSHFSPRMARSLWPTGESEYCRVFWNDPFLERPLAGSSGKPENETLEPLN